MRPRENLVSANIMASLPQSGRDEHWRVAQFLEEQQRALALLDDILESYRNVIGNDLKAYANHCRRDFFYTLYFMPTPPFSSKEEMWNMMRKVNKKAFIGIHLFIILLYFPVGNRPGFS